MNMKLIPASITLLLSSTIGFAEPQQLTDNLDKLSYSIGVDLGKNFNRQGIDINPSPLLAGMQDALANKPLQLSDEQMKETFFNAVELEKHSETKITIP